MKENKHECPEIWMLYLKTKGGVTVPLLSKRKTWYMCYKTKQALSKIAAWNGMLIINH